MTANATSTARNQARPVVHLVRAAAGRNRARLSDWWSRLATTGQLGFEREREIGRHTGARI